MKALVLGASGRTGFKVVQQLLTHNIQVKALTRNTLPFQEMHDKNLEVLKTSILEIENKPLSEILSDVSVVISCLGHNISVKGIFGKPHYLLAEAIKKICLVCFHKEMNIPIKKLIVMSTTACLNPDLRLDNNGKQSEKFSITETLIMSIMRALLPPQRDNEKTVKLLKEFQHSKKSVIEWVAVRPDTLTDAENVSEFAVFENIQRSPIFNAGKTSRINVAKFMRELITDNRLWETWKFKMPVIYNKE